MATEAPVSYIDTLLKRVTARGVGLGVRLETGAPVRVSDAAGVSRDATNRPLSTAEITAAVGPIIPDMLRRLPTQPSIAFNYESPGVGRFHVVIRKDGDRVSVSIDPDATPVKAPAPVRKPWGDLGRFGDHRLGAEPLPDGGDQLRGTAHRRSGLARSAAPVKAAPWTVRQSP